jgi:stage II sporulation protein P
LETGQDVRFSPSSEGFSPDFVETPHPVLPEDPEKDLPFFSGTDLVQVQYFRSVSPDLESLITQPLQWNLYSREPSVLIVHTHATESYAKNSKTYQESAAYRTLDEGYNMLCIGALVAEHLNSSGIPTLQDRTLHDYPSYNGSYANARKSIESYLEQYPSIQLVLDLHRDASESSGRQLQTLAQVDGQRSAQLMVVIGANHKGYTDNVSLGLKLHAQLESQAPGITRPMQLRGQRFNQDLLPGMLLIEVGAAGNTHEEARQAAQQLAQAVITLARGTRSPEEPDAP